MQREPSFDLFMNMANSPTAQRAHSKFTDPAGDSGCGCFLNKQILYHQHQICLLKLDIQHFRLFHNLSDQSRFSARNGGIHKSAHAGKKKMAEKKVNIHTRKTERIIESLGCKCVLVPTITGPTVMITLILLIIGRYTLMTVGMVGDSE